MGLPACRRRAATAVYSGAAAASSGRMRWRKSSWNVAVAACSSAVRRCPEGKMAMPKRISACVMVVVYQLHPG